MKHKFGFFTSFWFYLSKLLPDVFLYGVYHRFGLNLRERNTSQVDFQVTFEVSGIFGGQLWLYQLSRAQKTAKSNRTCQNKTRYKLSYKVIILCTVIECKRLLAFFVGVAEAIIVLSWIDVFAVLVMSISPTYYEQLLSYQSVFCSFSLVTCT